MANVWVLNLTFSPKFNSLNTKCELPTGLLPAIRSSKHTFCVLFSDCVVFSVILFNTVVLYIFFNNEIIKLIFRDKKKRILRCLQSLACTCILWLNFKPVCFLFLFYYIHHHNRNKGKLNN